MSKFMSGDRVVYLNVDSYYEPKYTNQPATVVDYNHIQFDDRNLGWTYYDNPGCWSVSDMSDQLVPLDQDYEDSKYDVDE